MLWHVGLVVAPHGGGGLEAGAEAVAVHDRRRRELGAGATCARYEPCLREEVALARGEESLDS